MNDLILCEACTRHLRRDEPSCPFCGAPVSGESRAAVVPRPASGGLSRAQLYAFHAAVATGVAAGATTSCGTKPAAAPNDAALVDAALAGTEAGAADAVADQTTPMSDDASDAATVHDATRDWGPIPTPYGCVFPPAECDELKA